MDFFGDQAVTASNLFHSKSGEEPSSRTPCECQHEEYDRQGQTQVGSFLVATSMIELSVLIECDLMQ